MSSFCHHCSEKMAVLIDELERRREKDKIDYVLLSPKLFAKATGGAVFRKGVWRGNRTKQPWEIYETLTAEVHAASDHAAMYADINL